MRFVRANFLWAGALAALAVFAAGTFCDLQETRQDVLALAEQPAAIQPAKKPIEERVIHLPADGRAFYCTVLTRENWQTSARDRELLAWFEADPRLASLRAQTHWNHYTESNLLYRARLSRHVPPNEAPAVMVQDATGKVYYKASAASLPRTAAQLAQEISDCFPRPKPPSPTPGPSPSPVQPLPDVPHIPDVGPAPDGPAEPSSSPLVLALAVFIGAVALGFVGDFKKDVRS